MTNYNIISNEINNLKNKRIIITGGTGMLGLAFKEVLTHHGIIENVFCFSREELDVTKKEDVLKLKDLRPNIIIHCAALVNADYCEDHELEAFEIIVNGTMNIINLAKLCTAKVFYPQSFLIYDGKKLPINETSLPNPLSVYGKLKLEAEKLVLKDASESLVVRMAGFFGGREKDKNFVGKFIPHVINLIRKGINSMEIGNRIWQPTYTNDIAYNCLLLLAKNKNGMYCMASLGKASFYELAVEIINQFGLSDQFMISEVQASSVSKNEKARRPPIAIIENTRLNNEKLNKQRKWQESLLDYSKHSYFKKLINEV